ncbi:MAG TPA: hypothetical protein VGI39_44210 [Polyangiaceae bacterium]|jgi:hypothetical protein
MRTSPLVAAAVLPLTLAACSARDRPPILTSNDGTESGDTGSRTPGTPAPDDAGLLGNVGASDCTPEATNYVYLLDAQTHFHQFDPAALTVTDLGPLHCPGASGVPYSMAVRRDGVAFSVFTDGSFHAFDVTTLNCQNLTFASRPAGFTNFGMGFATDGASTSETLYVSSAPPSGEAGMLGKIDPATMTLTSIGAYTIPGRAELTGTGDGRLFGAFEGQPYVVAQIDESSATIVSQAPQADVSAAPFQSNFAFAFWGGVFWLFFGQGGPTDFFVYDPATGTTTKALSVNAEIVGAGVSTCAPTSMPH